MTGAASAMAVTVTTSEHPSTMSRASATAQQSKRQAYSSSATRCAALASSSGRPTSTVAAASMPETTGMPCAMPLDGRQRTAMTAMSASWATHTRG